MESRVPLVSESEIIALCERAFGKEMRPETIRPLGGGTFNAVYAVTLSGRPEPVVLRVAPPENAPHLSWDDRLLMRREYAVQPFLAPLGSLVPTVLAADFTHQIVEQDCLFQTLLPGQCWEEIEDELSEQERAVLWEQFGRILRTLHSVEGNGFGDQGFSTWSVALQDRMERIADAMTVQGLDPLPLRRVQDAAQRQAALVDAVHRPRLLHGDLWRFNLLVTRDEQGARISGVLDADRAWWGDPAADWTMFVLTKDAGEQDRARFWEGYGEPEYENTHGADFRSRLYTALHAATVWEWAARTGDLHLAAHAEAELLELSRELHAW